MNKLRVFATLIVVALCATTIFTSCRNDDDDDNNGGTLEVRATNIANLPAHLQNPVFIPKFDLL